MTKFIFKTAAYVSGILTFGLATGFDAAECMGTLDKQMIGFAICAVATIIFGLIGWK